MHNVKLCLVPCTHHPDLALDNRISTAIACRGAIRFASDWIA